MVRALPYIVPIALALFALLDLWRSEQAERAQLHPAAWVAIIVLLPVLGPIAWIVVSRSRRAQARPGSATPGRPGSTGPAGRRPTRPSRPVAPDDDPDFLWRLEQEQRRRAKDTDPADGVPEGRAESGTAPTDDPSDVPDGTVADEDEPPR